MSKPCSVCTHPDGQTINAKLAQNQSYREIAGQFQLSKSALGRHVTICIADFLDQAREASAIQQAVITEASVTEMWGKIKRLIDMADAWLLDPTNPTRYTLEPRAERTSVIYRDAADLNADGTPKAKRGDLQELLDRLKAGGLEVVKAKLPYVDYPKVMLDAAREGAKFLELLAKLRGEFIKAKPNSTDTEAEIAQVIQELRCTRAEAIQWLKENVGDLVTTDGYMM